MIAPLLCRSVVEGLSSVSMLVGPVASVSVVSLVNVGSVVAMPVVAPSPGPADGPSGLPVMMSAIVALPSAHVLLKGLISVRRFSWSVVWPR